VALPRLRVVVAKPCQNPKLLTRAVMPTAIRKSVALTRFRVQRVLMIFRFYRVFLAAFVLLQLPVSAFAGSFEGTAAYRRGDFVSARREFGADSEEGAISPFFLALMYLRGEGGARDEPKGTELLRLSAERGYPAAQYLLASRLLPGKGGAKDTATAKELLRKAAAGKDYRAVTALDLLAKGQMPEPAAVAAAVKQAAHRKNADARYTLGLMHLTGDGVAKDPDQEIRWYRAAAAGGNPLASFILALMYQHGEGVKRNPAESARLMKVAAEKGNTAAQFYTGAFYYGGFGVKQDRSRAATWLRRAAERGYAPAQYAYGMLLLAGDGVPVEKVKAVDWLGKAAKQGDEGARETLQELVALRAKPGKDSIPELKNLPPPILEQPRGADEGVRLEGKGIVLDRGEFGLKFSLPDLNDAYAPPSAQTSKEPIWNRLEGGKFEIIFRPGR
jgi:uncharacterized protein